MKIARDWNVPASGVGYVTRFDVEADYLSQFPVRQVGGRDILEYWIPADRSWAMLAKGPPWMKADEPSSKGANSSFVGASWCVAADFLLDGL